MSTKALVALLGAAAIFALPVLTPDLAGGGSQAYAARTPVAVTPTAAAADAAGRGGRGGDGGVRRGHR